MKPSLGFFLCLISSLCFAQTATVKGRVIDASNDEPLQFCNVFINGTTLGVTSDSDGYFEIKNIPIPGNYEVIVSYVGYESVSQKVDLSESLITLHPIRIQPSKIVLSTVEVRGTRDKAWEKKMKRFAKVFLGDDREAGQCTILNPWVVDFPPGKDRNVLFATASEPIWIENKALGYKIKFILIHFSVSQLQYSITGKSFFQEIASDDDTEIEKWRKEREASYRNSKQYLFKSIIDKRITGEGFKLYTETQGSTGGRSQFFFQEVGKSVLPSDTTNLVVDVPQQPGVYVIKLPRRMEIHNMAEKDRSSPYRDVLHPISWIESKLGAIVVNRNGFEMGKSDAVTFGTINNQRVSHLLPSDYQGGNRPPGVIAIKDLGYLQEKIYVHTDKPYYYKGETIWFKGYIKYAAPVLKDSLSTTVYAELIGADKKVLISKMLEIEDGSFNSEFLLPDTIVAGDYYLRVYTLLNRNFGDDQLYTKYIPILELKQAMNPVNPDTISNSNGVIRIKPSKPKYKPREAIELTLVPEPDNVWRLAGVKVSVSVTDMSQVVPVKVSSTIDEELKSVEIPTTSWTLSYPIEYGFGFKAQYADGDNSPKEELLHVFQLRPRHFTMAQSNRGGVFSVNGLNFFDSAYFAIIQPQNIKPGGTGIATLLPREIPPIHLPATHPAINIRDMDTPQRSPNYDPNNVTMLEEVTVTAARIREDGNGVRAFGRPDQVVSGKDINSTINTNLLVALQGKLQGLTIRQFLMPDGESHWRVYLARNSSVSKYPPEVLVTINDNLMPGTPEEILMSMNMSSVISVELNRRNSQLYGGNSAYGVLAVYVNYEPEEASIAGISKKMLVYGYRRPATFRAPDYSSPSDPTAPRNDFRSTICWKPVVQLDRAGYVHFQFYAADLPGPYRVVVEGLSNDGTPIRTEKIIEISED